MAHSLRGSEEMASPFGGEGHQLVPAASLVPVRPHWRAAALAAILAPEAVPAGVLPARR